MARTGQVTQNNKFTKSLQYLKEEQNLFLFAFYFMQN